MAFRDGGLLEPSRYGEMYLFGSKKRREALEAQAQAKVAEMEAQKAAEAGSYGDYSTEGGFEGGAANEAEAAAAHAEAVRQGKQQLELLQGIIDSVDATNKGVQLALADLNTNLSNAMKDMSTNLGSSMDAMASKLAGSVDVMAQKVEGLNGSIMEVKNATNSVEGATHQVKDAVYATNAQGKLDQLISAISSLG